MYDFSIGVLLESFRSDIPTALKKASSLGVQGIQVYATKGELSPENMSHAKRWEFLQMPPRQSSAGGTGQASGGQCGRLSLLELVRL